MPEKIYVIGHKIPDLDSVISSIAYAAFKNKAEQTDKYVAVLSGDINGETGFILKEFGIPKPEVIDTIAGKNVILIDHNEMIQAMDGIESAKILEIIDHHKIDFKYSEPITFKTYPWGSSCSVVADEFFKSDVPLDGNLAAALLAGTLVDTIITKSPTCTEIDKELIVKLAQAAGIENWRQFGMDIFKVRSQVSKLSANQIIKSDFKDFDFKAGKVGIGQVETVDLNEFSGKEEELLAELKKIHDAEKYHTVILFVTDIIKEGSRFFVATNDHKKVEKALEAKLENGTVYIEGIVSRKKQVAPKFTEIFDN